MVTKIEWVRNQDGTQGYTINPVKGLCPMACNYCYARRMYKNPYYKTMYSNQSIRYDPNAFNGLPSKPSRVFVGSTMELFGGWIMREWLEHIFEMVRYYKQHTFIFLTKQTQNLIKWSPFPDNCWVGVSATNTSQYQTGLMILNSIDANIKFFSFEPLLGRIAVPPEVTKQGAWLGLKGIDWCIIGQQTPARPATTPKIEWIRDVVSAADKAGVPVFLKDNLDSLLRLERLDWQIETGLCANYGHTLRQEFPKVHVVSN
jgi:protein gp37